MTGSGRRASTVVLLAVVSALGVPLATAPVPAQEVGVRVREVGWWTRQVGAMPAGPGAFRVARQPDGDTSIAAIRLDVGGTVAAATLTLSESGGFATDQAAMRVCTTTAPWEPADPGPLASAPAADCARAVPLVRDDATGLWRASIASLLPAPGPASVLVVPDPASGLPLFQVDIASASVYADVVPAADPAPAPTETGTHAPFTPFGDVAFPVEPLPPVAALPFAVPPAAAGEPAPAVSTPAVTSATPVPFVAAASTSEGGRPKPWSRLVWMVPLALVVGVAVARRPLVSSR